MLFVFDSTCFYVTTELLHLCNRDKIPKDLKDPNQIKISNMTVLDLFMNNCYHDNRKMYINIFSFSFFFSSFLFFFAKVVHLLNVFTHLIIIPSFQRPSARDLHVFKTSSYFKCYIFRGGALSSVPFPSLCLSKSRHFEHDKPQWVATEKAAPYCCIHNTSLPHPTPPPQPDSKILAF